MFPLTRVPFWVHFFDPESNRSVRPLNRSCLHAGDLRGTGSSARLPASARFLEEHDHGGAHWLASLDCHLRGSFQEEADEQVFFSGVMTPPRFKGGMLGRRVAEPNPGFSEVATKTWERSRHEVGMGR